MTPCPSNNPFQGHGTGESPIEVYSDDDPVDAASSSPTKAANDLDPADAAYNSPTKVASKTSGQSTFRSASSSLCTDPLSSPASEPAYHTSLRDQGTRKRSLPAKPTASVDELKEINAPLTRGNDDVAAHAENATNRQTNSEAAAPDGESPAKRQKMLPPDSSEVQVREPRWLK